MHSYSSGKQGFTLAELLIALVILGVIATFTIPKVLQSQQSSQFKSVAKEDVATIEGAYTVYKISNQPVAGTKISDLTPYINYVKLYTNLIDSAQTGTTLDCSAAPNVCLVMHNGSVLAYTSIESFGNTATTNAVGFAVDPDGKVTDGTTNGPGKGVLFYMYYNGRVDTVGTILNNTYTSFTSGGPQPTWDPPWFSWS